MQINFERVPATETLAVDVVLYMMRLRMCCSLDVTLVIVGSGKVLRSF